MFPSKIAVLSGSIFPNLYYLHFDGTDDWIDCGDQLGDALGNAYAGSLSVSLWFKADVTSGNDGLFYIGNFSSSGEFEIMLSSNELQFSLNGWETWHRDVAFTDTASWHHLVCIYDTSGAAGSLMYLDNSAVGTATAPETFPDDAAMNFAELKTIIGAYHSSSYPFDGAIDEVAVYNKVLSAAEVAELYGGGTPQTTGDASNISSLIRYWRLEEGAGTAVTDSSGNNDEGTFNSAPVWTAH